LLNVEAGTEDTALRQLKEISTVEEAYISYGVYDLVVKIKADTMEALKETITRKIPAIKLVQSVLSLILTEE
jgi:DNA-binding Lrp family transcriptional regulator